MTANSLTRWKSARCLAAPLGLFAVSYALCIYGDHWLQKFFGTAVHPSVYCSRELPSNIFGADSEAWNDSELALQAAFLVVILPFLSLLALIHTGAAMVTLAFYLKLLLSFHFLVRLVPLFSVLRFFPK